MVIVPIFKKGINNEDLLEMSKKCKEILVNKNIRVILDDRENVTSGRKYNEWEMKGIPIRLEIGEKELSEKKIKLARRCDNDKRDILFVDLESIIE